MSRWKFTKQEIKEISALPLDKFLLGYEIKVAELLRELNTLIERSHFSAEPISLERMYAIRQLSVNCEKFGLIFRKKSIEFDKIERPKRKAQRIKDGKPF